MLSWPMVNNFRELHSLHAADDIGPHGSSSAPVQEAWQQCVSGLARSYLPRTKTKRSAKATTLCELAHNESALGQQYARPADLSTNSCSYQKHPNSYSPCLVLLSMKHDVLECRLLPQKVALLENNMQPPTKLGSLTSLQILPSKKS